MFGRHRHGRSTMRKIRPAAFVSLAVLLVVPSLARANCYSIYDAKNRLAFQSTVAPVDLSTRISEAMRARFAGGHLVMIPDDSDCREIRTGPTTSPRFDAGGAKGAEPTPEQLLQASPLVGGGGGDARGRDSVRSGTTLNVRRP
jgi:hypothetical protein